MTSALTRRRRRAAFIPVCSDSFDPSFDRSKVGKQPLVFSARKKKAAWQVTWRSSALSLGPPPLYQKTPPSLFQLLARVCNRGTVSFPLSKCVASLCRYVSEAALTGALTPVNAYLTRWALKFKYPYTPATHLMFVSEDAGFGQSYFFQFAGLQILFAASSGTLFSRWRCTLQRESRAALALLC